MYFYQLAITFPLFFFLHQTTFSLASSPPGLHSHLLDHTAVNCGSSGSSTGEDGRPWTGDTGSSYMTVLHGSNGKLISSPLPSHPVPYTTARLSRRPFTYTFRVSPGQKFIRLHFYPASYRGGFERSKAFFTVKAGPYTLLSNFSASLTGDALATRFLSKEFCLTVEENQPLFITFSPSSGGSSDEVYAFINGIEIISIPAVLYHTSEGNPAAHVIGKSDRFTIDRTIALEKVHRLNVGGSSIYPREDTGMFRDWYGDSNFLLEKSSVQPVDLGFRYLLRLHFCELEYEIKDRLDFSLFVNEQVAEANGDLIKWSGGNGVAVYRDYLVVMEGDRIEGKHDLLIKLRPHTHEWTEPIDVTLKGLEVLKLSNHDKNLAGVNPVPAAWASTSPRAQKLVFASGGNAIATCVVILLTVMNIIVYQLRILSESSRGRYLSLSTSSGESSEGRNLSSATSEGLCRRFSLAELISVTNNFDDELVIGSGGFGKVYRALIDDGATSVAMKRLNFKSKQGEMLSKLRHAHLVSLLGYCDERNEMILVYEFMENGSLAEHLYKIKTKGNGIVGHLSWERRLNICIGAARGLDYLHTGVRHGIIHRDVKPTNILLDKDWIAKISDFGLCKVGATSHSYVSTDVKGTFGFLDPEYFFTRRLTEKSDVYAFGVVMLEILCGRPAVDMREKEEQHSLVLWAQQGIKEKKLDQLIDPNLRDQISPRFLKVFAELANKCLDSRPRRRPTMADVVVRLECALASENQCKVPSTEEEEEEDFNVGEVVDEQFDEITQMADSLPQTAAPSSSTSVEYSENTQDQNRSKGKVGNVFQRSIDFLAKGTNIRWKKRKVYEHPNWQILPIPHLRIFSFSELKIATNNFSNDRVLGQGSSGKFYQGLLDDQNGSELLFAVINPDVPADSKLMRLRKEIDISVMFSHPNLLKLLGYCWEKNKVLQVHEFMSKGSLHDHLFGSHAAFEPLPWHIRLHILKGAAQGLDFLHTAEYPVIHRDFKPSNIWLDGSYNAKLSDFSLAKLGPLSTDTHVTTQVKGTIGYLAPEYMATGSRTFDISRLDEGCMLIDWFKEHWSQGKKLNNIMDSRLDGKYPPEAALQIAQLALECVGPQPKTRPSMKEVVDSLHRIDDFEDGTDKEMSPADVSEYEDFNPFNPRLDTSSWTHFS